MPRIKATAGVLGLLALWLPAMCAAAEPALLTLESTANAEIKLEVIDRTGAQLADPPAAASIWRITPGETVRGAQRPRDRVVELYTGTPQAPGLVGRVVVRYFGDPRGWIPHFLLQEEPLVVKVNGRWQPLVLPGAAGVLVRHGNTLPNADGFFPSLEFGLGAGELPIVAWQVRAGSPLQTVP